MSQKRNQKQQTTGGESALEHHVDEMMDKSLPDPKPAQSTAPQLSDAPKTHEADPELPTVIALAETTPAAKPDTAPPDVPGQDDSPEPADAVTDAIVDDIVVHESDELIASRDGRTTLGAAAPPDRPGFGSRLGVFFGGWWHNKLARYSTMLIILAGVGTLAYMPTSRYYAMNTVGVRSAASLTILDNTTQLPLKNVNVELGDRKSKTNQDGMVKLSGLPLGSQSLSVSQPGFATISKTVTLGLGSNPLGEFQLQAVGAQFRFKLTDYLSGKPVKDAEISSGDANAQADSKGQLVLTVGQDAAGTEAAKITANGYRTENFSLDIGQKQSRTVVMVPRQKEVYVSKQRGTYDVYKTDIDGRNKQVLLAASGSEDANMSLVVSPDSLEAAIVSRRDKTVNQDGFPLQALTLVDIDKGTSLNLDHSERIQIVDWIGDKLVYVKVKAGTSAGNPERYQLMSYDYETTARIQLATANNFNDVVSANGDLYFAASNNFQNGVSQLVKIAPDNTGKQVLLDKTDVWNIARSSYDSLDLSVLQGSYSYKLGDPAAKKVSEGTGAPSETRFYLDAADGKRALWTESRDGKGVLLVHNPTGSKDTVLATQSGLTYPARWLNARTIVYRVVTPTETADYAVSLDGGIPKKVVDLTNASGLGRFNYR